MSKKIFVTGTGTDVGKTYITGLIIKKLHESGRSTAYYKAAMSGNARSADGKIMPGDALAVKKISGISQPIEEMCPYVYEAAVSPHLASRIEGNHVKMDVVEKGFQNVCKKYDYVVMEGSGGILCPICFDEEKIQTEDIIKRLGLSCVLIADAGLGTINSVVLTAEYMRAKNLPLKGIIFNHYSGGIMQNDNIFMCEYMTGLKTIACVKDGDEELNIDADNLAAYFE